MVKALHSLLKRQFNQILRSNFGDVPDVNTGLNNISKQVEESKKSDDFSSLGSFISIDKITTNPEQPKIFDEIKFE